jgi:integrase
MQSSLTRWHCKTEHRYTAFDGRLYLERRPAISANWYARCCHQNKQFYKTTKSPMLADAQAFAEQWFLDIQSRIRNRQPVGEPTLATAYKAFISYHENDLLKTGKSSLQKIRRYKYTWNNVKELGDLRLSDITAEKLEDFRRARQSKAVKALTEKTLHADIGLVRMCLKYAKRRRWLEVLPDFPVERIKYEYPDWLTPEEFHSLTVTSQNRMTDVPLMTGNRRAKNAAKHIRVERTELHAFVWLMGHGCIRVSECLNLRWGDLKPHPDNDKVPPFKRQVLINIRSGKTGARQGVGTFGVEIAMNYLRDLYPDATDDDKLFTKPHRHGMARLLEAAKLRKDPKGRLRNAKTLRHTSIMLRFLYEPGISPFELGRIAGTSAAILDKYYLGHLTGSRVSDRLMVKAVEEFAEPTTPPTYVWATREGAFRSATSRAKTRNEPAAQGTPRVDAIHASLLMLRPGQFPDELHHNGQTYLKRHEEWLGNGSDRQVVSVIYGAGNGDTLFVSFR